MKAKAKCKIAIDAAMTLGLLFLMGYQLWGDVAHEWAGAGMFVLFIAHHVLNRNWYKNLSRGKYSPSRVFQLAVDGMVFLAMLGLMVSGIMLSNHVFAFWDIHGGMSFARLLHMAASYWGFVLMSLHLGLHWGMFTGLARKALRLKSPSRARKFLLPTVAAAIAAYGLEDQAVNSHRAVDDARAAAVLLGAMAEERDDLLQYVDLFGYSPKYGVSGRRIASVAYRPQSYQRLHPLYEVTETV